MVVICYIGGLDTTFLCVVVSIIVFNHLCRTIQTMKNRKNQEGRDAYEAILFDADRKEEVANQRTKVANQRTAEANQRT